MLHRQNTQFGLVGLGIPELHGIVRLGHADLVFAGLRIAILGIPEPYGIVVLGLLD